MKTKNYTQYLSNEDRVHVSFTQHRGRIVKFSVNYSAHIKGKWQEILRIDNCHGSPHMHRYYVHRRQFRIELGQDSNQAFTDAKKYAVSDFVKIKENYLRVRRGRKKKR